MNKRLWMVGVLASVFLLSAQGASADAKAKKLIKKMVKTVGPMKKLKAKKDVEYTYTYRFNKEGKVDKSLERYIFEGELSWAKYSKREKWIYPDKEGEVIQGFDGKESWATINGTLVTDPQEMKMADFMRKTNFYWFTMMQKLLDPGIIYSYEGKKTVNGINYDLVDIKFDVGVGDVSDRYRLFINPKTKLVDQFLFTVMDFNMKDPYLMVVEYGDVEGIKLPVQRKYIESNWDGDIKGTEWTDEISSEIQFTNNFSPSLFQKPNSSKGS